MNINKYKNLVNILDKIRLEAPVEFKKYRPDESNFEKINQARSRAFVHLFLKVNFGILDFLEREKFITDKDQDGGIDAYYVDKNDKKVFIIQSKFRTNSDGFESKEITYEELLKMDVDRILKGEKKDETGIKYNGKILQLQRELAEIGDIGKYDYKVIILANVKPISATNLKKLTGGFEAEIYDFEGVYKKMIFPVVAGTFYAQDELRISINLAGKSSGAKVTYNIETESGDCDITVLFVLVSEIAKTLYEYKNTILRYNPRSYLEMKGNSVNKSIYKSIVDKSTNEFALFNNGITILSDETDINEKVGKKDLAQLIITNPQIINGGQTSFTLSRIYEEILNKETSKNVFDGKEVLLRIVTLDKENITKEKDELSFIEAISKSTNNQTQVKEADRRSNDKVQIQLQESIFDFFGMYYERKSGEFADGIKNKYISRSQIINRVDFLRMALASSFPDITANPKNVSEPKLFEPKLFELSLGDGSRFKEFMFAYICFKILREMKKVQAKDKQDKFGESKYGKALRYGDVAVAMICKYKYYKDEFGSDYIKEKLNKLLSEWSEFENKSFYKKTNTNYFNKETQEYNPYAYYKGQTVNKDLLTYFKNA